LKKLVFIFILIAQTKAFAVPQIQADALYFQNIQEDLAWFEAAEAKASPQDLRTLFLRIYHSVTLEMPTMFAENQFENPEWVDRLMLKYVSLYRHAYDCSYSQKCAISPAWQKAFLENKLNAKSPTIQLLLSISAHVNRDLPIALASLDTEFRSRSMHRDFQRISLIFQRRMPELISVVQDYQKCKMGSVDRKILNQVIQWAMNNTREEAWIFGEKLSRAKIGSEEAKVLREIEANAKKQDLSIVLMGTAPGKVLCD
jgi:hypothetical protein